MKLTIGIPNYNGGELLVNTILSCKNLLLDINDYEILVVDNCSNDDTLKNIDELKKSFPNIRLVINEYNVGRIGNWNRVLDLALGEKIIMLMVGDKLLDFDYNLYFENLNNNDCLVFGIQIGEKITYHWAQKINVFLDTNYVLKETVSTIGHNYGLTPLQTHFISRDVINKYNLRFDDEFEFLADLKFLNKYLSYFERVKFINIGLTKWWDGKNKTTFQKQLLMFDNYLKYFPNIYEEYNNKKINNILFNIYIVNQIFFIFLNNKRTGIKGFTFFELIDFVKKTNGNILFIFSLIFFPLYILYLYINIKTNFKFPIYF